jgi:hypothetical protein
VTGNGELPRDSVVQSGSNGPAAGGAVGPATGGDANPNADTKPGGGIGTPLDKDAERDPWTKYRWYIIFGFGLLLAGGAGVMLGFPNRSSAGSAIRTATPVAAGGALQVLRDEMFAVETDRLEGRLNETQYAELKAAYDVVLRRALARNTARSTPDSEDSAEL